MSVVFSMWEHAEWTTQSCTKMQHDLDGKCIFFPRSFDMTFRCIQAVRQLLTDAGVAMHKARQQPHRRTEHRRPICPLVPRWKVPPQRSSEKSSTSAACWCDFIDLWDDMRWHEMTCTRWSFDHDIYHIYIFHVDLRCFTRQTYPRTPRFDRYLWPISSYWPTEFRGAASWDVSIFLKLRSFAMIWYHLITIRSLIRTVDQQSFAQFVICWRISSINRFNYPVLVFLIEVWFVWIEGLCVTVCWLITVVGVCGSLGAPQMKFWSFRSSRDTS